MLYAFDFKYAGLTIDAAVDDDGNEWIATPTISRTLELSSQRRIGEVYASKSFKAFAGEGFECTKFSGKTTKGNASATFYSKETFLKLLYYFCNYREDGNSTPQMVNSSIKARNLVFSGFLVDFEGSIKNALGTQLTEEEREYLRELIHARITAFRKWTDIIRDRHIKFYGVKPEGWYYGKLIKKANLALFGVPDFGNDRTENMTVEQQETIKEFEYYLARKARNNPDLEPEAVLDMALNHFTS